MGKSIGLKQLAQKTYVLVQGMPFHFTVSIGEIEDAWDAIIYGASGNGKTNFTVMLLKALLQAMNCKAEYVAYEEGHGKTVQDTMIKRHNMLEAVGNKIMITEHLSYDELVKRMSRKQSAKIWVIDSLQAAQLTYAQCKALKEKFVMSRKRKIIIYISWSEGKVPQGACAKSVEYYSNIKMRVQDLVMFPKSRYGGNCPFIIYEPDAIKKWGKKPFNKIKSSIPPEPQKSKNETDRPAGHVPAAIHPPDRVADIETNSEIHQPII